MFKVPDTVFWETADMAGVEAVVTAGVSSGGSSWTIEAIRSSFFTTLVCSCWRIGIPFSSAAGPDAVVVPCVFESSQIIQRETQVHEETVWIYVCSVRRTIFPGRRRISAWHSNLPGRGRSSALHTILLGRGRSFAWRTILPGRGSILPGRGKSSVWWSI